MVDNIRLLADIWPIVVAFIGLVVWLVRQEGQNKDCSRDHQMLVKRVDLLEARHEQVSNRIFDKLSEVQSEVTDRLARIETQLKMKKQGD